MLKANDQLFLLEGRWWWYIASIERSVCGELKESDRRVKAFFSFPLIDITFQVGIGHVYTYISHISF